jgi:hypothetical protein
VPAAARRARASSATQDQPHLEMATPLSPLSPEDVLFFVEHGYLIKRAVLDPAHCCEVQDAMWSQNESSVLRQHEPSSHVGPIRKEDEDSDMMNYRKGDQWRLRGMCSTPLVLDLFP